MFFSEQLEYFFFYNSISFMCNVFANILEVEKWLVQCHNLKAPFIRYIAMKIGKGENFYSL